MKNDLPLLAWSEGLELGLEFMDGTHREFVDLLAVAQGAADDALPAAWQALVEHTQAHFGAEDDWMRATGFAASNCHTLQHKVVLDVLKEGLSLARQGELAPARQMAGELAVWFPQHAQTMDAALALHLRSVEFDPQTGVALAPAGIPAQAIHGCGGASCSAS